jgi:hypothetical protein
MRKLKRGNGIIRKSSSYREGRGTGGKSNDGE